MQAHNDFFAFASGKRGLGKSALLESILLSAETQWLVLDLAPVPERGLHVPWPHVRVAPGIQPISYYRELAEHLARKVMDAGNCGFMVDELDFVVRKGEDLSLQLPWLYDVANRGRHKNIQFCGAARRPFSFPPDLAAQATDLMVFYTPLNRDRKFYEDLEFPPPLWNEIRPLPDRPDWHPWAHFSDALGWHRHDGLFRPCALSY